MMELAANLEEATRLVNSTLVAARAELAELDRKRSELVALIARTNALQRALSPDSVEARMTLHEAIGFVLEERANRWMTAKEIADEVNKRSLYRKKDGSPVEINQIHARVKNYGHLFDKDGSRVRLAAQRGEPE
jgi:hypothetical protein